MTTTLERRDAEARPMHEELRELRQQAGVSSDDVAAYMGMTATSLRARERGERTWYPDEMRSFIDGVAWCRSGRSQSGS